MHSAARDTVSHSGIARAVLSDARHKAVKSAAVGYVAALIDSRVGAAQLVPPNPGLLVGAGSHLYGLADEERFVGPEIVIWHAGHETITDRVHVIAGAAARRLGHAKRV